MSTYQPTLADAASTSAARVRDEDARISKLSPGSAYVRVGDGDLHRVALEDAEAGAYRCDCRGYQYHGRCAHVEAVRRADALEGRRPTDADTWGKSSRM